MIQDYWGKIDGTVHYFSEDGTLRTGWIQDGRNWYFHTPDGEKQSSWMKEGQTWYYFKKSGRMSRGFTRIGQNWYYFDVSGAMQTGSKTIYGRTCSFSQDGRMISPSLPPANPAGVPTLDEYEDRVDAFLSDPRFANGAPYGMDQTPYLINNSNITACAAYITDFTKYVFDKPYSFRSDFTNINEIQTGDILRLPGHYVAVLQRSGSRLITAEGNMNFQVVVSDSSYWIQDGKLYAYSFPYEIEFGTHNFPKGIDN